MQSKEGVFIAIEGIDGAGKGTQFELLVKRLGLAGYDVLQLDFPRYQEPSSYFVKQYLNGAYGSLDQVGPYTASLFYALDRYEAANRIREALARGHVVLTNRFTGSSMAHQGTKFRNADERRGFFIWLDNLEFEMLHIPRPDLNLVLRVPAEIAQSLVDKKEDRDYTTKKRDLHEADINHLRLAAEVYDDMCQLFPRDYMRIDSVRAGKMLPLETISNLVWEKVFPFLPKPTRPRKTAKAETAAPAAVVTENPFIEKSEEGNRMTDMGRTHLAEIITDTEGPVYGFTDTSNPASVAAAMARMGRSGQDLRFILLDEFTHGNGKADDKLQDSGGTARQLAGMQLIIEDASLLLARQLERGRLAAYVEQSGDASQFEQKDDSGNYKYYVPEQLDEDVKSQYRQLLDTIFDRYAEMLQQLTHYLRESSPVAGPERDESWQAATKNRAAELLRPVLPLAATTTVGMFASAQSVARLIARLQADTLPEAAETSRRLFAQAQKIAPAMFTNTAESRINQAGNNRNTGAAAVQKLAAQYLPGNHAELMNDLVDMVDVWPRNELQIVSDLLYEHSNLSLRDLQSITESWPYDKKANVLQAYLGEQSAPNRRPGRALEKMFYAWDIVCDYDTFRELQRHRRVNDLEWQELTPRYGYDVPEPVDAAGLTEMFEECFDTSLKLYSALQNAGFRAEAPYATLLGHKLRWKVTFNAREAFRLHKLIVDAQSRPNVRKLIEQMHEKIAEAHPLTAAAMRYTGKNAVILSTDTSGVEQYADSKSHKPNEF
jgi:dTMP kinase